MLNGHGFLMKDPIRDYTQLQEGPKHCYGSLNRANIDSSSMNWGRSPLQKLSLKGVILRGYLELLVLLVVTL